MKKKFKPYYDKIEIKPVKQEAFMPTDDQKFIEVGKVIAVGSRVKNIKIGQTIYFLAYGCDQTPEIDGVTHYVVTADPRFILGTA
jgi:co-chaperonin GroES (HSP10)